MANASKGISNAALGLGISGLAHYGVLGMKWGVPRQTTTTGMMSISESDIVYKSYAMYATPEGNNVFSRAIYPIEVPVYKRKTSCVALFADNIKYQAITEDNPIAIFEIIAGGFDIQYNAYLYVGQIHWKGKAYSTEPLELKPWFDDDIFMGAIARKPKKNKNITCEYCETTINKKLTNCPNCGAIRKGE